MPRRATIDTFRSSDMRRILSFGSQRQLNRHVEVVKVLAHGSARAKLSGARANYLIVNTELRNARAFDPLREEVAHVPTDNLRGQPLEIVDRSILVSILFEELSQQLSELILAQGFAQHAKDHRAFVEHN